MAKKIKINPIDSTRKLMEGAECILGKERVINLLKQGKIKKVLLTSNCSEDVKESVEKYAALSKAEVTSLSIDNEEMGIACKKPFLVSVVGMTKSK